MWALELARAAGLCARLHRDGPLLQLPDVYRPVARALHGADIAMLVGLPVSAVVYLLACRSLDLGAERQRAAAADAGLEG